MKKEDGEWVKAISEAKEEKFTVALMAKPGQEKKAKISIGGPNRI